MTKNTVIFIFLNMLYLLIWYATNKIRSTKVGKELDNGFEFYNSLNTSDKENYWKEDTKILNLFFVLFIISMNISVILLFFHNSFVPLLFLFVKFVFYYLILRFYYLFR